MGNNPPSRVKTNDDGIAQFIDRFDRVRCGARLSTGTRNAGTVTRGREYLRLQKIADRTWKSPSLPPLRLTMLLHRDAVGRDHGRLARPE